MTCRRRADGTLLRLTVRTARQRGEGCDHQDLDHYRRSTSALTERAVR